MAVQFTNLLAEIKLAKMQENLALKKFGQCHSTDFWQQVPESKYPKYKRPVYSSFLCITQHIARILSLQ